LKGIELGFWLGEVWAQNDGPTKPPRFTHGEGAAFDTTHATEYRLNVAGDSYSLLVGGVTLLSGTLRDYSPEGLPYTTPNFVFVGDDTTSAGATSRFFSATLGAPEPSTMLLGASSLMLLCLRTRRRRA